MKRKKITKKEAREKYGIITTGASSLNSFFLLENGDVVDDTGSLRFIAKVKESDPIHYGDYGAMETEELSEMRESLMDYLEKGQSKTFIRKFHELMEVERELTLREGE